MLLKETKYVIYLGLEYLGAIDKFLRDYNAKIRIETPIHLDRRG